MTYTATHAGASRVLTRKGASVTFTRSTLSYTASTDGSTSTATTITGDAIRVEGKRRFRATELVQAEDPRLFFAPDTFGSLPAPGDVVTWASTVYTVKAVEPIAPDGNVIAAYVELAR